MRNNGFGEVISQYTRADMLDDGTLVAADPDLTRQAGIRFPVAYTYSVAQDCIEWSELDAERHGAVQDSTGREWDVLIQLRLAMQGATGSHTTFRVARVARDGTSIEPDEVELHAVIGGDDQGAPVITVLSSLDEL